jgi:hypothetical protein
MSASRRHSCEPVEFGYTRTRAVKRCQRAGGQFRTDLRPVGQKGPWTTAGNRFVRVSDDPTEGVKVNTTLSGDTDLRALWHLLASALHQSNQDWRAMARDVRLHAPHGVRGGRRRGARRVHPQSQSSNLTRRTPLHDGRHQGHHRLRHRVGATKQPCRMTLRTLRADGIAASLLRFRGTRRPRVRSW